jgi:hypothetical protein
MAMCCGNTEILRCFARVGDAGCRSFEPAEEERPSCSLFLWLIEIGQDRLGPGESLITFGKRPAKLAPVTV